MQNFISHEATNGVDRGYLFVGEGKLALSSSHVPHNLIDLVIFELVENAIRADKDIVKRMCSIHLVRSLRLASHNAFNATQVS